VQRDSTLRNEPEPDPIVPALPKNEMSERLKHKQDSVDALAKAGDFKHEALILETATVHFNFEFNSAEPDQESLAYLDNLVEALRDNPKLRITIVGHTDNIGSDKFNLKLSMYRANAIRDFLIENGVESERVLADGKGMGEPLNKNKTEADRALNRRVVLTIFYED
jgi:outer membrane protein OmpA-like peptidoglycan-associated protein